MDDGQHPRIENGGRWVGGPWSAGRLASLLIWGAALALTIFVLWPTLWTGPGRRWRSCAWASRPRAPSRICWATSFWGVPMMRPGPLFYPVALVLRLTPWTLLGLLALPLALRRAQAATRRDLAALVGFVLLFILAMSIFPRSSTATSSRPSQQWMCLQRSAWLRLLAL